MTGQAACCHCSTTSVRTQDSGNRPLLFTTRERLHAPRPSSDGEPTLRPWSLNCRLRRPVAVEIGDDEEVRKLPSSPSCEKHRKYIGAHCMAMTWPAHGTVTRPIRAGRAVPAWFCVVLRECSRPAWEKWGPTKDREIGRNENAWPPDCSRSRRRSEENVRCPRLLGAVMGCVWGHPCRETVVQCERSGKRPRHVSTWSQPVDEVSYANSRRRAGRGRWHRRARKERRWGGH